MTADPLELATRLFGPEPDGSDGRVTVRCIDCDLPFVNTGGAEVPPRCCFCQAKQDRKAARQ